MRLWAAKPQAIWFSVRGPRVTDIAVSGWQFAWLRLPAQISIITESKIYPRRFSGYARQPGAPNVAVYRPTCKQAPGQRNTSASARRSFSLWEKVAAERPDEGLRNCSQSRSSEPVLACRKRRAMWV